VADNVIEYAVRLVNKTRPGNELATASVNEFISYGAGPRAGQFLISAAKCHALMQGKMSPDMEDVQAVAIPVLRHRIVLNYKAEAENIKVADFIKNLF
jgi:MoxR-like ATPase